MRRLTLTCLAFSILAGCSAFKSDLDDKVVQPKPWGPPGGAGKYKTGAAGGAPRGAPEHGKDTAPPSGK